MSSFSFFNQSDDIITVHLNQYNPNTGRIIGCNWFHLFPNQKKTIIWNANKNQYETNTGDKLKYLGYQTTISSTQRKRGFFTASKLLSGKIAEGKIFGNMVFDNKTCSFSQSDKKTIFFNPASMSFDEKLLYSQINTPLVVLYSVALVNALNTKNRLLQ